jgi:peptidoglycan hydrolase CwlO-like protein
MFKKNTIMFITAILLFGSIAGCDWFSGKSNATKSLEKLQAELVEAKEEKKEAAKEMAHSDYTYAQKMLFVNEMKRELQEIQAEMDRLSEKVERSNNSAKLNAQKRIDSLREELELTKTKIDDAQNANESGWEDVKRGFRKANDNLKKSFEDTRQWLSDKIEP